jgi:hypothetical protein
MKFIIKSAILLCAIGASVPENNYPLENPKGMNGTTEPIESTNEVQQS